MKRSDHAVMAAAMIPLVTSIYLWFGGHRDEGLFVALWCPRFCRLPRTSDSAPRGRDVSHRDLRHRRLQILM